MLSHVSLFVSYSYNESQLVHIAECLSERAHVCHQAWTSFSWTLFWVFCEMTKASHCFMHCLIFAVNQQLVSIWPTFCTLLFFAIHKWVSDLWKLLFCCSHKKLPWFLTYNVYWMWLEFVYKLVLLPAADWLQSDTIQHYKCALKLN